MEKEEKIFDKISSYKLLSHCMTNMHLKDRKNVVKHSAAIQISNEVNLLQRRAWNVLLANAFDDLDKEDEYEIKIRDLCNILKYKGNNIEYIKQILRDLVDIKVEWNILGKDGNEWGVAVLLAQAKIVNGVLTYGYAPVMRKRLHNPTMYAKINLSLQNRFDSKHSLALYELFLDYFNVKIGYGETPFISVDDFRKLLGLKESEYREFKDLSKCIIKKATKEINAKSDLFVEVKQEKKGRRVTGLKFCIKRNENNAIEIKALEKNFGQEQVPLPLPEFEIDNPELFQVLINQFGISKNKAIEILQTHDEFYIQEVLIAVKEHIEKGKIKNIPAFTIKAIEEDYRKKKTSFEIEKEEKKKQRQKEQEDQKIIEDLKTAFEKEKNKKFEKALKKVTAEQEKAYIQQFEKEVIDQNQFLKGQYEEKGLESVIIKSSYHYFLEGKILSKTDLDFIRYAKKQGYELTEYEDMGSIKYRIKQKST